MALNYFIAYDLISPGQNYDAVIDRIKTLGVWAHMQFSLFYLQSDFTQAQLHAAIRAVMDPNDRLAVILAADAFVSNYPMVNLDILRNVFQRAA